MSSSRPTSLSLAAALAALLVVGLPAPVSGAAGPYLVKDINGSGSSNPAWLTAVGDTLFFSAKGPGGRELWKSDGTVAGTLRVKNIRAGTAGSTPINLTNVNGTLYFQAFDGTDWGIWKSDGSAAGTQIVDYIDADHLTSFLGMLYFVSGDELWRTDGTPLGTTLVKQVATWPDTFVTELEVAGDRLFIAVAEGANELWISDGTNLGTTLVKNIEESPGVALHTLTRAGDRLFFLHDTEGNVSTANPAELWTSNGTGVGTRLVKDIVPGDQDYVSELIAAQGRAFFIADGDLWKSNGFASGTKPLGASASSFHPLTNAGGTVYFVGLGGIWKTDGTIAGTEHVSDIVPHVNPFCDPHGPCGFVPRDYDPVGAAGQLVFPAKGGGLGIELWRTNSSPAGAGRLGDLRPGPKGSQPADLTRVGNAVFFTADDGSHGRELWTYVP